MNSIKCKSCGIMNFSDAVVCAKCGSFLLRINDNKEKPRIRFSFGALLAFTLVGAILYYMYGGIQKSMNEVDMKEANRAASQPKQTQPAGLSRTEYDHQRAGQYGNAVQNSNSLSQAQSHNDDLDKAIKQSQQ